MADLTDEARRLVQSQPAGADPTQVARAALFEESGVRPTSGAITQDFAQQRTEEQLLGSASDPAADAFREFKLAQSKDIDDYLSGPIATGTIPEESGRLVKDALLGRNKLLRTQKNELYKEFAEASEDVGEIPLFTDSIKSELVGEDFIEDMDFAVGKNIAQDYSSLLKRFGILEATDRDIMAGLNPVTLNATNFERLRKSLNALATRDHTGMINVATGPILKALDKEVDELGATLDAKGVSSDITGLIKEARKRVRTLKTEFSPQSLVGRLIDTKKDGVTDVAEASKIYSNNIAGRSVPVEDVRKVMGSLERSGGKGGEAIASLQSTTMLDLMDAGFGTKSRKIDGVPVFNPVAFKNRVKQLGGPKLSAIFKNNPGALSRINNIDMIAKDLIPDNRAVPKGSADVVSDLANKLVGASISAKVPGIGIFSELLSGVADNRQKRLDVASAMRASPQIRQMAKTIDESLPSLAAAMGIAGLSQTEEGGE